MRIIKKLIVIFTAVFTVMNIMALSAYANILQAGIFGEGDWRKAYIDYIDEYEDYVSRTAAMENREKRVRFSLGYVDDDDIPELFCGAQSSFEEEYILSAECIATYSRKSGKVDVLSGDPDKWRTDFWYIPGDNRVRCEYEVVDDKNTEHRNYEEDVIIPYTVEYDDTVFEIRDGSWQPAYHGKTAYRVKDDDEAVLLYQEYMGTAVTPEIYASYFDLNGAVENLVNVSAEGMKSFLSGDTADEKDHKRIFADFIKNGRDNDHYEYMLLENSGFGKPVLVVYRGNYDFYTISCGEVVRMVSTWSQEDLPYGDVYPDAGIIYERIRHVIGGEDEFIKVNDFSYRVWNFESGMDMYFWGKNKLNGRDISYMGLGYEDRDGSLNTIKGTLGRELLFNHYEEAIFEKYIKVYMTKEEILAYLRRSI